MVLDQTQEVQLQLTLEQELGLFNNILSETKLLFDQYDLITIESVDTLLSTRQEWIDMVTRLELIRNKMNNSDHSTKIDHIKGKIKEVVKMIRDMDQRVFDFLQKKKIDTVKEISKVAENHNKLQEKIGSKQNPRFINIVQE